MDGLARSGSRDLVTLLRRSGRCTSVLCPNVLHIEWKAGRIRGGNLSHDLHVDQRNLEDH